MRVRFRHLLLGTAFLLLLFTIGSRSFWRPISSGKPAAKSDRYISVSTNTRPPRPGLEVRPSNPRSRALAHRSAPVALAPPHPVTERKFAQFDQWTRAYLDAAPGERKPLELEGVQLALKRRDELVDLIQTDPSRALELATPFRVRRELPASVLEILEERISGRGSFAVLAAVPEKGEEGQIPPVYRTAEIAGVIYQVFVYGRRLHQPTRHGLRLHGIALDGFLALHEDSTRILDVEEFTSYRMAAAPESVCAIDGAPVDGEGEALFVESGGGVFCVCSEAHAALLNEQFVSAELETEESLAASPWTEGIKRLLLIRVDFSDLDREPLSESSGIDLIENVHAFYQEMSYGKTGFALAGDGSEVTPVFRMPETAAYYGSLDASRLRSHARAAARDAGYDLRSFDLDVICFGAVPGFRFAGLAYVGAAGAWLRNSFSTGVAAHELGHNLGLNHANFWDTSGQSVIGTGTSVEYGDTFDTMGSANAGFKHFNARYKNLLNWLPSSDVIPVSQSGTYQITAYDDPNGTGARALRMVKNSRTNYWVEFRQRYTSNKWLMEGAGLRWAGNGGDSTRLLDTTPGSTGGKDDSAILIGRTFSDNASGIHITPVRKTGIQPESLEVVVNLGSFSENRAPVLLLAGQTNSSSPSIELVFTASAADPDGDPLAYHWDFGDQNFGSNQPEAHHRWSSVGEYTVRCVVTDMKGGQASDSLVVRVGSPSTHRLSGQVTENGAPLEGVRVYVSSTRMAYTGSDGRFHLVGLVPGSYTVRASLEGYTFIHSGFLNPLSVGPSRVNVDFIAVARTGQNTRPLIAAGSVWQYLDDGSNPGPAWRDLEFDDSHWNEGPAPLGYGDDNEKTVVSFGPNSNSKFVTTYFRHRFAVESPGLFSVLSLGLRRDDGGVVFLNGRQVFRSNMPSGNISYTTLASSTVGGNDERTFFQMDLDPALLHSGTNILAVEIHQVSRSSSDIAFDVELLGTEAPMLTPPNLAWRFSSAILTLSWPEGPTEWSLYSGSEIVPNSAWSRLPLPIESIRGERVVSVSFSGPQRFYQLKAP